MPIENSASGSRALTTVLPLNQHPFPLITTPFFSGKSGQYVHRCKELEMPQILWQICLIYEHPMHLQSLRSLTSMCHLPWAAVKQLFSCALAVVALESYGFIPLLSGGYCTCAVKVMILLRVMDGWVTSLSDRRKEQGWAVYKQPNWTKSSSLIAPSKLTIGNWSAIRWDPEGAYLEWTASGCPRCAHPWASSHSTFTVHCVQSWPHMNGWVWARTAPSRKFWKAGTFSGRTLLGL